MTTPARPAVAWTRPLVSPVPDHRPPPLARPEVPPPACGPAPLPLLDVAAATVVTDADPVAAQTALVIARAACDVATGRRTAGQLGRWCRDGALAALVAWAEDQRGQPRTLRSLRIQQPSTDAAEACVRLTDPEGRSSALAIRLERTPTGAWLCTVADAGPLSRGACRPFRGSSRPSAARR